MGKLNTFWNCVRRYKYFFVVCAFVLLVGVIDENSFVNRFRHQEEIRELRQEIRKYTDSYNRDSEMLEELRSDPEAVVRLARERYYMREANEDVFVVREMAEETAQNEQDDAHENAQ